MKYYSKIFLLATVSLIYKLSEAQSDSTINQYGSLFNNSFIDNPAYTGLLKYHHISFNYHLQKSEDLANQFYFTSSYDYAIGKKRILGMGFYYKKSRDKYYNTERFNLSAALNFKIGRYSLLRWGASVLDFSSYESHIQYPNFINPKDAPGSGKQKIFSAGVWYSHKGYYKSLSINNLKELLHRSENEKWPYSSKSKPSHYSVNLSTGYDFDISDRFRMQSNLKLLLTQVDFEVRMSLYCIAYRKYVLGVTCFDLEALTINYGFQIFEKINLGGTFGFPVDLPFNSKKFEKGYSETHSLKLKILI